MKKLDNNLMRDLGIIFLSVAVAVILACTGALKDLLESAQELKFIGSILAGMFFVSVFTVAPAAVVLVEIARVDSVFVVAFFGGLGALLGDLVIFKFIKDSLLEDIWYLIKISRQERLVKIFKLKLFRWLVPFIGALIVASPLPDEIGLTMMGLSKIKTLLFIPISFILNFIGIMLIGLIAQGIW